MVINIHAHLSHEKMFPDKYWNLMADAFSKLMGVPIETTKTQISKFQNYDADFFIKQMDAAGIEKALVMTIDWGGNPEIGNGSWSVEKMNQWVAEQVEQYPDKLFALCAVDPRRKDRAVKLLDKAVQEWGMKGLKLYPPVGFYPDDPAYFPLYEKCVELDVPIYSHTAVLTTYPFVAKYADPIYLETIAAKFPDLKVVLVHFGGMTYTLKCLEIMLSRANVYAEFSGSQIFALSMEEHFLKNLRMILDMPGVNPLKNRLMFGTDWPYLENVMRQEAWVEWFKNIAESGKKYNIIFKQGEIKRLLSKNAKKILKI